MRIAAGFVSAFAAFTAAVPWVGSAQWWHPVVDGGLWGLAIIWAAVAIIGRPQ